MPKTTVDRRSKTPLDIQVTRLIRTAIFSDAYGNRLPDRFELMESFDIDDATLDKVLERLTKSRLIAPEPDGHYGINLFKSTILMDKRVISLEEHITRIGRKFSSKDVLMKTLDADDTLVQHGFKKNEKVVYFRRVYFADDVPVSLMDVYLPLALYPDLQSVLPQYNGFYRMISEYYGFKIGVSHRIYSARTLTKEMAELLNYAPGSACFHSAIETHAKTGELLEYSLQYTTAEIIRMEYSLARSELK